MQFDDAICRNAICAYAPGDAGDEVISESHKCKDLSPVNSSSVNFLSLTANVLLLTFSRLVVS